MRLGLGILWSLSSLRVRPQPGDKKTSWPTTKNSTKDAVERDRASHAAYTWLVCWNTRRGLGLIGFDRRWSATREWAGSHAMSVCPSRIIASCL